MDEQSTVATYAAPVLVELGTFSEDTLGDGTVVMDDAEGGDLN